MHAILHGMSDTNAISVRIGQHGFDADDPHGPYAPPTLEEIDRAAAKLRMTREQFIDYALVNALQHVEGLPDVPDDRAALAVHEVTDPDFLRLLSESARATDEPHRS